MRGKWFYKRLLFWAACIFGVGCFFYAINQQAAPKPKTLPAPSHLQIGDWIFRSGRDSDSLLIKHLSQSDYSHVGMIVETQPHILLAHATTDDDPQKRNQVLLSRWEDFVAPSMTQTIAIARLKNVTPKQSLQAAQYAKQQVGRDFVLRERQQQPFYCTLLLVEAWAEQDVHLKTHWQYVDVPVLRGEYLFPQGLLNEQLHWLDTLSYAPNYPSGGQNRSK